VPKSTGAAILIRPLGEAPVCRTDSKASVACINLWLVLRSCPLFDALVASGVKVEVLHRNLFRDQLAYRMKEGKGASRYPDNPKNAI